MSNNSKETQIKYFQIAGGDTVLQHDETGWIRWDIRDGLVPTDITWSEDDSRLISITKEQAIALMK